MKLKKIETVGLAASLIAAVILANYAPKRSFGDNTKQNYTFEEGIHYKTIDVSDSAKKKLGSLGYNVDSSFEIFSYTCAHCFSFESVAKAYEEATGDEIAKLQLGFESFPIAETHYYLEKSLSGDNLQRAKTELYTVMTNPEIASPRKSEILSTFATGQAISNEEIAHLSTSAKEFAMASRQLAIDLNLSSTPTLYLHGKYQVDMNAVGSIEALVALSNQLSQEKGSSDESAPQDVSSGSIGEAEN